MMIRKIFCAKIQTALSVFLCLNALLFAGEYVKKLDLTKHASGDKVNLKKLADNEYEWNLPTPLPQTIHLDFNKLGINPAEYDELRFDIQPQGSMVGLHTVLHGFPEKGKLSSWYLKFKTPVGKWTSGRYDLRVDDDGVFIPHGTKHLPANMFTMSLSRRVLGFPGEPTWRKALIRNPRLVKYRVKADIDLLRTEINEGSQEISYVYKLKIKNLTDSKQKITLEADSKKTLKYFKVEAPETITLESKSEKIIPVKLSISRIKAESMAPLYSEPCLPKVSIAGVPDSDFSPIIGFRSTPMWAVVPILNKIHPSPAETMAFLAAREKALPGIENWEKRILYGADKTLKKDWPVYCTLVAFDQLYRCNKCKVKLLPVDETKLDKHYCPKCKRQIVNDKTMSLAYASIYRSNRFKDIRNLALAYQISGEKKYAEKAIDMLYVYAEKYPEMPVKGWRSTAGGSKISGSVTLRSSWLLPNLAEAYHNLKSSPYLTEAKRQKIEAMLNEDAFRTSRHSVEYSNMQAEHIRAYGSVGLATGFWPLVGEAIGGEFGWHEVVEFGYSEEGVSHEAGAYHRAIFGAMVHFANFAYEMGANLLTPRFKRVFDGSTVVGLGAENYELAYRVYRDPAYLSVLKKTRAKNISTSTAFLGILGLADPSEFPVKSNLFKGTGYIFLRKGTASDNYGIKMNYIKTFDRLEYDKFQTRFYRNGIAIDEEVGRIPYSAPESGWMEETAAHNTIVIDGKNQRSVDGKLVVFDNSKDTPAAVIETDDKSPLYEGVDQLRGIILLENCYIVFDRVSSEKPHTVDLYQYGKGKVKFSPMEDIAGNLNFIPKHGDFKNISKSSKGKSCNTEFQNGLKLKIVSDKNFNLYRATTIKGYQPRPCEVIFARAADCKEVTFLSAFVFGKKEKLPELEILKSSEKEIEFKVKSNGKDYTVTVKPEAKTIEIKN